MTDDVKALIAEARTTGGYVEAELRWLCNRLADALEASLVEIAALTAEADRAIDQANNLAGDIAVLEASVQAPETSDAECGDYPAPCNCENPDTHDRRKVSVQAPAVDPNAMPKRWERFVQEHEGNDRTFEFIEGWPLEDFESWLRGHDAALEREAEARGLEKAEQIARAVEAEAVAKRDDSDYPESHYGQHLDGQARGAQVLAKRLSLARAQQVREGATPEAPVSGLAVTEEKP